MAMLHIILSLFTSGIIFSVVLPILSVVVIIFIMSHFFGIEPSSVINIIVNGWHNFITYIADCFEYIKHLF